MLYQPLYCEENAWHLCQTAQVAGASPHVVVVSNEFGRVAMWSQRAAPADAPIAWDYHVFVVANTDGWHVWDPDFRLGIPAPLAEYIAASFVTVGVQPAKFDPEFRIMTGDAYRESLRSDRSHMLKQDGSWIAPPPDWPTISDPAKGSNLRRFYDLSDEFIGTRGAIADLLQYFAEA